MNVRRVLHTLGGLQLILGGAQLLPIVYCVYASERTAAIAFLTGAIVSAALGVAFRLFGSRSGELYRREGVLIVVGAWVLASVTGAIPYLLSGAIPSPVDALFESASGFTTTGASILVDIERAGVGVLFWRSFTQWLGGIGIIVIFVALLSELGPGARVLYKLEVPGPKAEILHSHVRETAAALFRIYLVLSAIQLGTMLLCGLDLYDALTHTFSTVSTGGFSPHAASAGHFTPLVRSVIMLFMLAAGVNFSLYYAVLRRRNVQALRDAELRLYGLLLLGASIVVAVDLGLHHGAMSGSLALDACFQVVSIVTTTGFATTDFAAWPDLSRTLIVVLMVFGGCAGSTAGGAKLIRAILGWKAILREVQLSFSPHSVIAIAVDGKAIPNDSVRSVAAFLMLWVVTWGVGSLLLSVGDPGIATAATASISTLANVGPGLAAIGPEESYAFFADWQKLLMIVLMWLGRLELFALFALFQRRFWQR